MSSCQLCSASYVCLRGLVSHIRGTHSEEVPLDFVCQVNDCPITNTWYKHVVNKHREDYDETVTASPSSDQEGESIADDSTAEDESEEEDNSEVPMDLEVLSCMSTGCDDTVTGISSSPSINEAPVCINEEDIAGKLIRLKEKHMLSHAAVDEVVELVQMVCDNTVANALSEAVLLGEECNLDMTSEFFKQLPDIFETLSYLLARIGTAYRQQSYIVKNLPYVVS